MHIILTILFCQDNCFFVKLIADPGDLIDTNIRMVSAKHFAAERK